METTRIFPSGGCSGNNCDDLLQYVALYVSHLCYMPILVSFVLVHAGEYEGRT